MPNETKRKWSDETRRRKKRLVRKFFKTTEDLGLASSNSIAERSGLNVETIRGWMKGRLPKYEQDVMSAIQLLQELDRDGLVGGPRDRHESELPTALPASSDQNHALVAAIVLVRSLTARQLSELRAVVDERLIKLLEDRGAA